MTIFEQLEQYKIIPVAVLNCSADARPLGQALLEGGLPCVEVTFRTPAAAESITVLTKEYPSLLTGAGTVLTVEQAKDAINAGACFIVSPGFNAAVVSFCLEKKIPVIPGVSSPTEIEAALSYGLTVLKFFPAEALGGLVMIKALSAPYRTVRFIPTGGINGSNLVQYLENPRVLACGGSWMLPKEALAAGDFKKITRITAAAVDSVKALAGRSAKTDGAADTVYTIGCSAYGKNQNGLSSVSDPVHRCTAKCPGKQNGETGKTEVEIPAGEAPQVFPEHVRVVTFGEIMLRLAPFGYTRFVQADSFGATYGGAEANVAVSLANYGLDCAFVTKLPLHEIGQGAVNALRRFGVDTSGISRGGNRIGIYYLEKGASQRPSKVIYDRLPSALSEAVLEDFDWDTLFNGASWFHFTGITPALSHNTTELCRLACRAAKQRGITVSCDLNYRKKLWSKEQAQTVMSDLCRFVDVCIANEEDAADVFGIVSSNTDVDSGKLNRSGYEEVAAELVKRFGFRQVAVTLRESLSASDNNWSAMLYENGTAYFSKKYAVRIVDRVGGGDSFGAGLIYGTVKNMAAQERIEFAAAASCLKHSIEGDFNAVSADEVLLLAAGNASGRVQR